MSSNVTEDNEGILGYSKGQSDRKVKVGQDGDVIVRLKIDNRLSHQLSPA
jgi:hypothetical protein